jgi:serpin B
VYFKASWANPFPAKATEDGKFNLLDGSQVTAPMMFKAETMPYLRGEGYQTLAMPFAGVAASLVIILPDSGRFEAIEKGLDFKFVKQ